MYDTFSDDYDRFVQWEGRLAYEMPFIEQQLQTLRGGLPLRVLDSACGTGMHAITLAQRGYAAAGADLSAGMIEKARRNAQSAGVEVRFEAAGFGALAATFGRGAFDALLCLGNSLPHLLTEEALGEALADFAACLRSGGLLLVQSRNFDAVMTARERWMEPQSHREGAEEWVFLRQYDFDPDGLLTFNILTLRRKKGQNWQQGVTTTRLRPLRQAQVAAALAAAGFSRVDWYGDMTGAPFEAQSSGNLVFCAWKPG